MSGATFSHQQPCFLSYLPSLFSLFHTSILNFFLSFLSCPLVPSCSFFLTFFLTHLHLLSSHAFVSFSPLLVLICERILKLDLASFKTPSSMLINLANLAIAVLALLWSNGALVNRTGIVILILWCVLTGLGVAIGNGEGVADTETDINQEVSFSEQALTYKEGSKVMPPVDEADDRLPVSEACQTLTPALIYLWCVCNLCQSRGYRVCGHTAKRSHWS